MNPSQEQSQMLGNEINIFQKLVDKLTEYFSPQQNSTFEKQVFRNIKSDGGDTFNNFLLKIRNQASKCTFGNTTEEAKKINIKKY